MVKIELHGTQTGYEAVGEYVRRYWEHNIPDTVIVSLGTSEDGNLYLLSKEVVDCVNGDMEYLHDWWEGEKYIILFGIKTVEEIDISGGIYGE